jgi:major membrane immunogen (membrane-anchored lipoprotein)
MKKMFVVSLVLAAALLVGCSKKNQQTTPTGGDMSGAPMGGDTYGDPAGTRPEGTPQEGSDADNANQ